MEPPAMGGRLTLHRSPRRRLRLPALLAVAAMIAVACGNSGDGADGDAPAGAELPESQLVDDRELDLLTVTKVAQLPHMLTGFTASASGEEFLVSDRRGLVWRLVRTDVDGYTVPVVEPEPILDIADEVSTLGERGFFSLMLADEDESVVVNYTANDGAITVEQFPYEPGEPIERAAGRVLLTLPHPYAWHHGGDMDVDEEGNMYVAVGDMEFRQIDPPGPQDPTLILGGIVKVPAEVLDDPDTDWEVSPDDMVARGLRNPWRISIAPDTGDLWIGDVGLDSRESVYVIPSTQLGVEEANFGWPYVEGSNPHQGTAPDDLEIADPVLEHEQDDDGTCGMVGGFLYSGERIPELQGRYVYGDLCGPAARSAEITDDLEAVDDRVIAELPETVISFGEDSNGELYALGALGGLYRLDPPGWTPGDNDQEPVEKGPELEEVPRSMDTCDGMVAAVLPLSEMGSLTGAELAPVMAQVNADVEAFLPQLPGYLLDAGLDVQAALLEMTRRLEEAGWQQDEEDIRALRDDMIAGTGAFEAFPEAMATIVDAECG